MTLKQKQLDFIEAYITNGNNATQAAISAGYSERSAGANGNRMLKNAEIKNAIEERQRELYKANQLTTDQILSFWADVATGKINEIQVTQDGTKVEVPTVVSNRLKASELAAKATGLFNHTISLEAKVEPLTIVNDIPEVRDD